MYFTRVSCPSWLNGWSGNAGSTVYSNFYCLSVHHVGIGSAFTPASLCGNSVAMVARWRLLAWRPEAVLAVEGYGRGAWFQGASIPRGVTVLLWVKKRSSEVRMVTYTGSTAGQRNKGQRSDWQHIHDI